MRNSRKIKTPRGKAPQRAAESPFTSRRSLRLEPLELRYLLAASTFLSVKADASLLSSDTTSLAVSASDIVKLDEPAAGAFKYSQYFDGSDVGLLGVDEDVDAFDLLPDGSIVLSTLGPYSVSTTYASPEVGTGAVLTGTGNDLLKFTPTSVGDNTKGSWSVYLNGAAAGLGNSSENIDCVSVMADERILISTSGGANVSGGVTADNEDLLAYTPSTGTWSLYFDGTAQDLTASSEDTDALFVEPSTTGGLPSLLFSTRGLFNVTGASGDDEDIVRFRPTQLGATTQGTFDSALAFDGSLFGLKAADLDGFHVKSTDGPKSLAIGNSSVTETDSGTVTATFTVTLSASSTQPVKVNYATANQTATAGSDYVAQSGSITFNAGVTSQKITVAVNGDTLNEGTETFAVQLSNPTGAVLADAIGVGTITDNDAHPQSYYASIKEDATLVSSNASTLAVSFSDIFKLDVPISGGYQYSQYFDGSDVGLLGVDEDVDAFYLQPDGSIVLSTLGPYSVSTTYASPEVGTGALLTGTGNDLLKFTPTSVGDITKGSWSLYLSGAAVGLGNSSENIDCVSVLADETILISTSGGAKVTGGVVADNEDLLAYNPSTGAWSLYFDGTAPGLTSSSEDTDALFVEPSTTGGLPALLFSTRGKFSVTGVAGDDEDMVRFRPTQLGASTQGTFDTALAFDGSLFGLGALDLDGFNAKSADGPKSLSVSDSNVNETDTGSVNATFTVTLSGSSTQTVKVAYTTSNRTALAGSDYVAKSGTLTFNPNVTSQTVTVAVNGDTLMEGSETFALELSSPNGAVLGDAVGIGTITDNDAHPQSYYASIKEDATLLSSDASTLAVSFSDIFRLDVAVSGGYKYSQYFDGSDVGLLGVDEDVDAFDLLPDGSIVLSTLGPYSVSTTYASPEVGTGAVLTGIGSDLLKFTPNAVGDNTTGSWSLYLNGTAAGLASSSENIDAVNVLANGQILISTSGAASVGVGVVADKEDLLSFVPNPGVWSLYFDGTSQGFTSSSEDVDALFVEPSTTGGQPALLFSTRGKFSVTGAAGDDEDMVRFHPTQLGANTQGSFDTTLAFDGSLFGLGALDLDGFEIKTGAAASTAAVQLPLVASPATPPAPSPAAKKDTSLSPAVAFDTGSSVMPSASLRGSASAAFESATTVARIRAADLIFAHEQSNGWLPLFARRAKQLGKPIATALTDELAPLE